LLAILFLFVIFFSCGEKKTELQSDTDQVNQEEVGKKVICPVCGKEIEISSGTPAFAYKGKIYYFCSWEEKKQFTQDPEKFVPKEAEKGKKAKEAEKGTGLSEKEIEALGYKIHKLTREEIDQIVPCPGCQMYLTTTWDTPALEKDGEIHYFCSRACMEAFLRKKK
jgi:YHS domain-containing protein